MFSCAASALQQFFGLHLRLAYRQWSLAPDKKMIQLRCTTINPSLK
jgi:hypothetical protein